MLEFHEGGIIVYDDHAISADRASDMIDEITISRTTPRVVDGYTPNISHDTIVLPNVRAGLISRESYDDYVDEIESGVFEHVDLHGDRDVLIVSEWSYITPLLYGDAEGGIRVFPDKEGGIFGVYKKTGRPSYIFGENARREITHDEYPIHIRKDNNDQWTLSLVNGTETFMVMGPVENSWEYDRDDLVAYLREYMVPTHIPGMLRRPFSDVDVVTRD